MPSIRTSVVISSPIETAFDFIATANNCTHWQDSVCTGASERLVRVGDEIVEQAHLAERRLTFRWTVRTCARPESLVFEGHSTPAGTAVVTYTLAPAPKGTRVSREFRYNIPVLLDDCGNFFGLRNRLHAESAQSLRRLKRILEQDLRGSLQDPSPALAGVVK